MIKTMNKIKLSVVLATRNEEENIAKCLESVRQLADEIIILMSILQIKQEKLQKSLAQKYFLNLIMIFFI